MDGWSRSDKIALLSVLIAIVSAVAAIVVVPEVRRAFGLDGKTAGVAKQAEVPPKLSAKLTEALDAGTSGAMPPQKETGESEAAYLRRLTHGKFIFLVVIPS